MNRGFLHLKKIVGMVGGQLDKSNVGEPIMEQTKKFSRYQTVFPVLSFWPWIGEVHMENRHAPGCKAVSNRFSGVGSQEFDVCQASLVASPDGVFHPFPDDVDSKKIDLWKLVGARQQKLGLAAPDLYLDVVPIGGRPDHPEIGGTPTLEWAVRMRQFPADARPDLLARKS